MAEIQARLIAKQNGQPGVVPQPTDLEAGELAVNTADRKLFSKDESGNIIALVDSVSASTGFNGYRGWAESRIDPAGSDVSTLTLNLPTVKAGDLLVAVFWAAVDAHTDVPTIPTGWTFHADPSSPGNQSLFPFEAEPRDTSVDPGFQYVWLAYKRATETEPAFIDIGLPQATNLSGGGIISISNCANPSQIRVERTTSSADSLNKSVYFTEDYHNLLITNWVFTDTTSAATNYYTNLSEGSWLSPAAKVSKRFSVVYVAPDKAITTSSSVVSTVPAAQEESTHVNISVVFGIQEESEAIVEAPVTSVNSKIGDVVLAINDLSDVDTAPVVYGEYSTEISPVTGLNGQWSVVGTAVNVSAYDSVGRSMAGKIQDLKASDTAWLSADGLTWVTRTLANNPVVGGSIVAFELTTAWTPTSSSLYLSTEDPVAAVPGAKPGDVLLWNETTGIWEAGRVATPVSEINDLNDVDTESDVPEVGEFLKWDGIKWVPGVPDSDVGVQSINGLTGAVIFGTNQLNDYRSVQDTSSFYFHDSTDQTPADAGQWRGVSTTEFEFYPVDTDLANLNAVFTGLDVGSTVFIGDTDNVFTSGTLSAAPTIVGNNTWRLQFNAPGLIIPTTEGAYIANSDPTIPVVAAPRDKQVMTWDQSEGYWRPDTEVITELEDMENVVVDNPASGEGLVWDNGRGRWINGQPQTIIDLTLEKDVFDLKLTGPGMPDPDPSDLSNGELRWGGLWLIPGATYRVTRGASIEADDTVSVESPSGNTSNVPLAQFNPAGDGEKLMFTVPTSTNQPRYYEMYCGGGVLRLPIAKPHDSRQVADAYGTFTVRQGTFNYSKRDMMAFGYNIEGIQRLSAGIFRIDLNPRSFGSSEIENTGIFMKTMAPIVTPTTTSDDPFTLIDWRVTIFNVSFNTFDVEFYDRDAQNAVDPEMFNIVVFGGNAFADPHFGNKDEYTPAFFRSDL